MAQNISTLKALGGGDFSSLAAWLAWYEVLGTKGETAECYDDGGNLGDMTATVVPAQGLATSYSDCPKIIAATGHEHGGNINSGAAAGTVTNNYLYYFWIENMRLDSLIINSNRNYLYNQMRGPRMRGNLIWQSAGNGGRALLIRADANGHNARIDQFELDNNIICSGDSTGNTITAQIICYERYNYTCWITGTMRNNLFIGNSAASTAIVRFRFYEQYGAQPLFINLRDWGGNYNNAVFQNGGAGPCWEHSGGKTLVADPYNCMSSDGTVDTFESWGSVNCIANASIEDTLQDWENSNFALVRDGPAHEAGKTHSITTDMVGTTRPVGTYFDIGPLELSAPDLDVFDGLTEIADGETTPIDFGSVAEYGSALSKTFTCENNGVETLNISSVTVPSGYTITTHLPATIAADGSASVIVELGTSTPGNFAGDIEIVSDDPDENPYNFAITGTVTEASDSLIGAIVARFDNETDATITTLQGLVSDLWADEAPSTVSLPYVVVSELSETPINEGKDYTYRVEEALIQFDAFSGSKATTEAILEGIEDAYRNTVLTFSDGTQVGRPLVNTRLTFKDHGDDVWQGMIELRYLVDVGLSA